MRVGVLSVLLATWVHSVFGVTIEIYPPSPRVNQTVIFNVRNVNGNVLFYEWFKGEGTGSANQIIWINAIGTKIRGNQYFDQADVSINGSLEIKDVQKSNEGAYTVSVQATRLEQATVHLTLHDDSTGGLSDGAIAGIIIGVLAAVAIVIAIVVYLVKGKSGKLEN